MNGSSNKLGSNSSMNDRAAMVLARVSAGRYVIVVGVMVVSVCVSAAWGPAVLYVNFSKGKTALPGVPPSRMHGVVVSSVVVVCVVRVVVVVIKLFDCAIYMR